MLTLTIPQRRDPIARGVLLVLLGIAVAATLYDNPALVPNVADPIVQQYAFATALLIASIVFGRARQLPQLPAIVMPTPRITLKNSIRFTVFKRDGYRCRLCGATAATARLEVDHKIALANGGGHDMRNLWTLCERCNNGKSSLYL